MERYLTRLSKVRLVGWDIPLPIEIYLLAELIYQFLETIWKSHFQEWKGGGLVRIVENWIFKFLSFSGIRKLTFNQHCHNIFFNWKKSVSINLKGSLIFKFFFWMSSDGCLPWGLNDFKIDFEKKVYKMLKWKFI